MSTIDQSLDWLRGYLGYDEGRNNANIFALMAGHLDHQPWCATFLVAMARSTGLALPEGATSAYTPTQYGAFRKAGLAVAEPSRGDWGFVYYESQGRIGHVFAVDAVDTARGHVRTLEGNTNVKGSSSGGSVASLVRDYRARGGSSHVYGFVRPQYDGVRVTVANAAQTAGKTGALVIPAVYVPGPRTSELLVDEELGSKTITRWQEVMGTSVDGQITDTGPRGSELVRAVQTMLNDTVGARLTVDGRGIRQDGRKYQTVEALQGYLGTARDGRLSTPKSEAVGALQRALNAGTFLPARRLAA